MKPSTINWQHIRTFLAIGRAESLRAAAASLGVTHSTVSRQVHQLQEAWKVRLVALGGASLELTAEGRDVLRVAEEMEAAVLGLERRLLGTDERPQGTLRLSIASALLRVFGPELRAFQRRYPEIDLVVDSSMGLSDLSRRDADVVLRMVVSPLPENLFGRKLGTAWASAWVHEELRSESSSGQLPWIGWGDGLPEFGANAWMREQGIRPCATFTSAMDMLNALEAGIGAAHLLDVVARRGVGMTRIQGPPRFAFPLWVVCHEDLRNTAKVRLFMKDFGEQVGKHLLEAENC